MMQDHYKRLYLMDKDGKWRANELETISEKLLPTKITAKDAGDLLDDIASISTNNPYLVKFLCKVKDVHFSLLSGKVKEDGDIEFPKVIGYALIQDRLTKAQLEDPRILEACINLWKQTRKELRIKLVDLTTFGWFKLHSIEKPLQYILKAFKRGRVYPRWFRRMLPINILEAILYDKSYGLHDNAASAWVLFRNRPGAKFNPKLGTGEATISDDGKKIETRMALPKLWTDLYTTWNLAFVSQFEIFPYYMVKLLIPFVLDYKEKPEQYIYKRMLALYTQVHFHCLGTHYDKQNDADYLMKWFDEELSKFWGKLNKVEASLSYEAELIQAKRKS